MKITVEATDLQNDQKYSVIVESWETLDTVRGLLADKIPNANTSNQHFYLEDTHLSSEVPVDQLRKMCRSAGVITDADEQGGMKLARCFVYINAVPLDFDNMMLDDLISKLRAKRVGEEKQIVYRMELGGSERKFSISVDSASITVEQFKSILMKKMGPSSVTGLAPEQLLLYERSVQPGRPLEGTDLQPLFGSKIRIDVDGFVKHDPVLLRVTVKKWMGFVIVEHHELSVLDHMVVEDLKKEVCELLKNSTNSFVSNAPVTPENIKLKINGYPLTKNGCKKLVKKFGIPPQNLWLRAFNLKDRSTVNVYL